MSKKRKILRRAVDQVRRRECSKSSQKEFSQYEFTDWLDNFLATRQGKSDLPVRDQSKKDEDT